MLEQDFSKIGLEQSVRNGLRIVWSYMNGRNPLEIVGLPAHTLKKDITTEKFKEYSSVLIALSWIDSVMKDNEDDFKEAEFMD